MCAACAGLRTPACPRTGASVILHVKGKACPRGWHPDKDGIVRWLGVRWYGVPFPIRAYLYARLGQGSPEEYIGAFAGCGCVVALKDWYERRPAWASR